MNHISQIKAALSISGVATRQCSWRGEDKSIHLVMVTTYGLSANSHTSLVQNSITLDDLFLH